ncbi:MAG: ECF-type sigma factor [Bacteroidota bacterium]
MHSSTQNEHQRYDELLPIIYDELRDIAHHKLRFERADHTLNTTALVHEAYMKLSKQNKLNVQNEAHFMALAAQAMRRILVNYARDRQSQKRQHHKIAITQAAGEAVITIAPDEILALEDALEQLSKTRERQAKIIELWFFGGYKHYEIATLLDVSVPTVRKDWQVARAWLNRSVREKMSV